MSKKNRRMIFDKLVAEDRLSQDDGALIQEFGNPAGGKVDINFSAMTIKQLKDRCDKENLVYNAKATKDDLVVILEDKSDEVKDGD
ncbi:MAG: hypothetical protein U9N86_10370 [Bacteroidota bacterium]|nr:hypothetical protein [Bacteroidota bacterium]